MNNLVKVDRNMLVTTSEIIANGVNNIHKNVVELIQRHEKRIKRFRNGILPFETEKRKAGERGRPKKYYILDEKQAMFLISLMDNSEEVLDFKEELINEFFRMKKQLISIEIQHSNEIWLEQRKQIKEIRKNTTDIIKKFVEYAKEQGSKNAERYYSNITKMENKALFFIQEKYKNIRDILNIKQLNELKQADEIIEKALEDGMENLMYYKDIFKLAKLRVETFSELKGKSAVPFFDQISMLEESK